VSYRYKHNEANGENNHDGTDANFSENYGAEGDTTDAATEALRKRQIKNFLLTLLVSRGVPMLLSGDEFRRTQRGNNNAYCQDNETSWSDWSYLERHQEIHRFVRGMIAFRKAHPVLSAERFYTDDEIQWLGPHGGAPNWANPQERQFGCLIEEDERLALLLLFNAGADPVDFDLPPLPPAARLYLAADTSLLSPRDLYDAGAEPLLQDSRIYRMGARGSAILLARKRL
jgi:glycogen operon protein